jgi:hypothetical protein
MDFSNALEFLKQGKRVYRKGWNGQGMYISLQVPDENSKMTRPYVYMTCPVGSTRQFGEQTKEERIPWLVTNGVSLLHTRQL